MNRTVINKDTLNFRQDRTSDNLLLIDKPEGWTSFDVVKKVRNIGRFKKVGHGGTLDPFATGLIILATGKETRSLSNITNSDKSYLATIQFGQSTDTFDVTGKITQTSPLENFDHDLIKARLLEFMGESLQIPPMFSAKKISGKRLYKLARQGQEVDRKAHTILIKEIKILSLYKNILKFNISCSKGTYIRSIANDLGNKTGFGAFLKSLRRIGINDFSVENALSIDEFENYWMSLN